MKTLYQVALKSRQIHIFFYWVMKISTIPYLFKLKLIAFLSLNLFAIYCHVKSSFSICQFYGCYNLTFYAHFVVLLYKQFIEITTQRKYHLYGNNLRLHSLQHIHTYGLRQYTMVLHKKNSHKYREGERERDRERQRERRENDKNTMASNPKASSILINQ